MTRSVRDPTCSRALARLTRLAGRALDAPVVCASLVGADRRLVTSSRGLSAPAALLVSWPFMKHVIASRRPLVVTDGRQDPRAARIPAVRDGTVTAYVGMPLVAPDGRAVGTLSVMDRRPRRWSAAQLELLRALSARVLGEVGSGRLPAAGPSAPVFPVPRTEQRDASSRIRRRQAATPPAMERDAKGP